MNALKHTALLLIMTLLSSQNLWSSQNAEYKEELKELQNFQQDLSQTQEGLHFYQENAQIFVLYTGALEGLTELSLKHENPEQKINSFLEDSGTYINLEALRARLASQLKDAVTKEKEELNPTLEEERVYLELFHKYYPEELPAEEKSVSESEKKESGKTWYLTKKVRIHFSEDFLEDLRTAAAAVDKSFEDGSTRFSDFSKDLTECLEKAYKDGKEEYDESELKTELVKIERKISELGRNLEEEFQRVKEDIQQKVLDPATDNFLNSSEWKNIKREVKNAGKAIDKITAPAIDNFENSSEWKKTKEFFKKLGF